MRTTNLRLITALTLVASTVGVAGCVQNRPSRNGVFNENQYVRKDFLIRPGTGGDDPGWMLRASVTAISTPNPFGGDFFLTPGLENGGSLVRFQATEDHLQMLSQREVTGVASDQRVPEVTNSWPITNVDLKYRVNLDGETTNFYEENQEADWQDRQWVKIKWAKNDMSDVAPLGSYMSDVLSKCSDPGNSVSTLVPNSWIVDDQNNYMEWTVSITMPIKWDDAACITAYGYLGVEASKLGRNNVTFNLKYSLMRAKSMDQVTYKTLTVDEKDPIRHKYGFFDFTTMDRDETSGQLAARQLVMRFDPQKPIVWYFAPNFPANYKAYFTDNGGPGDTGACGTAQCTTVACQTNCIMQTVGAPARLTFRDADDPTDAPTGAAIDPNTKKLVSPRQYGDVRYNMLVWMTDRDTQQGFAGLTQFTTDPRTGETLSASIMMNDFSIKDYYVQRIDAFLQSLGASAGINTAGDWPDPGPCQDGDTLPIVSDTVSAMHNGTDSVYQKMQVYLQKPQSLFGNLGPQDFIATQDEDFFKAYFAIIPYMVYADPDSNQFVIREGGQGVYGPAEYWQQLQDEASFQQLAAKIDQGNAPYEDVTGPNGLTNATNFLNQWRDLTIAHTKYQNAQYFVHAGIKRHLDGPDAFSIEQVIARDARHCINGKWETKQQWVDNLISTYWSQVAWHEFGHSLGLTHNFMASVDRNNFPQYKDASGNTHYGLFASSVMEYNAAPDRVFWHAGWAPYDQGAISWIYGNSAPKAIPTDPTTMQPVVAQGISGQIDAATPWNDKLGFQADGKTETQFLFCNEAHLAYTPLCRQGDLGVTPSEIIANQIENYEWQYQWNNFRQYRKFWDSSGYANIPANLIVDMRKFLSLWIYDWGASELADTFRRIGVTNPDMNGSQLEYYSQLTNKFNAEASAANQMVGAFHKAIIQQSAGERPYRTIYDKFYGDTTQQGIILDKLFAMQGWVALWPTDNYDQNQAGGYVASYEDLGDSSFNYVAEDAVTSMIGGQYDVFPYFVPLAIAQFAQDTHSPSFGGRVDIRDWIGGFQFTRLQDFLDYFRDIAVQNNYPGCTDVSTCSYDPRSISDTHNEFLGPDQRKWIWAYIADRNQWVAVQKNRNTASYIIVRNYTDDVIYQMDDGAFPGGAYSAELPMKYYLDSFAQYN